MEKPNKGMSQTADALLRLAVEAAPSGMIMVDQTGSMVLVNAQTEKLFGYAREELIGRKIEILIPERFWKDQPDQKAISFAEPQVRSMWTGRDAYGVAKDGREFPVETSLNPVTTAAGRFVLAAIVDSTERRRKEEEQAKAKEELETRVEERTRELEAARDLAQEMSRLKSEFLANMSHEIRTPMNAIIGMCNVLSKSGLDSRQGQYARHIHDGAKALLSVINDILDFSKIEAGKLELEVVDFDPVRVVESTCELLATSARGKQLSLMAYIDSALPDRLQGDPDRLRQVLINLASNAIKFSDHGEIVVRADLEAINGDTVYVRFAVTDQGIGLTGDEQGRLFEPFVQADGSISRRFGGTGLGLSICKRLIGLMNGSMGLESSRDHGSKFWFVVPLERRSHSSIASVSEELRDVRILIVDDELQAPQILHNYVVSWGMRSSTASSAKEALSALRQSYVDGDLFEVAIIDYGLPGMNGIDLSREISKDPAISGTKLILLAAFDTPGLGMQAIDAGFKAYMTKPVTQSQMLESIQGALTGSQPVISRSAADARLGSAKSHLKREELILIVEDYLVNQQVAQLYLDELGFASHTVSNGKAALESIKHVDYALVLMDCQMPELDGFATTSAIREAEALTGRHTPIIAMTAHAMSGDRERCLVAGMDDYISKPVDPDQLRRAIEKWLPSPVITAPANISAGTPSDHDQYPIDLDAARVKFGAKAQSVLELFLKEAPQTLEKMRQALATNDMDGLEQHAHGLKGMCGTAGVPAMRRTCTEIETAVRNDGLQTVERLVEQLNAEYQQLECFWTSSTKFPKS